MTRISTSIPADHEDQHHEFLQNLLSEYIPREGDMVRPVALRSTTEQRRIALKSFLVRTWFDHALYLAERLLLLVLAAFFAYWLINGYGRDWLHSAQQRSLAASAQPTLAGVSRTVRIVPETPGDGVPRGAGTTQTAPLPFVDPDLEAGAPVSDYIAPQAMAAAPELADARPHRLIMPTIDVDTPVIEVFIDNGVWQVAEYAAGYHHGSALPGRAGNTVMAGHAGMRGGVFRDLGQLRIGDEIRVAAGGWEYIYQVREVKNVWPTQVEVMNPTPTPVLTLITCTAWDTQRLVVVADLVVSRPLT